MRFCRRWREGLLFLTLAAFVAISGGCSAPLDAKNGVSVTRITTGWLDAGLDNLG